MTDTTVVSQLTLAVEWGTVGQTRRAYPLVAALQALGYEPPSDNVDDVVMSIIQTGSSASIDELITASAHKPGRTWVARVAACLHLLLDDTEVADAARHDEMAVPVG